MTTMRLRNGLCALALISIAALAAHAEPAFDGDWTFQYTVDAKTLEGQFSSGAPIKFVRQ